MASSRKLGNSDRQFIKTCGASGADYTSIATWEANTDHALATDSVIFTGSVDSGKGPYSSGQAINFYNGSGGYVGTGVLTHYASNAMGTHKFSVHSLDTAYGSGVWADVRTGKISSV